MDLEASLPSTACRGRSAFPPPPAPRSALIVYLQKKRESPLLRTSKGFKSGSDGLGGNSSWEPE